jgi:hypothetical protein
MASLNISNGTRMTLILLIYADQIRGNPSNLSRVLGIRVLFSLKLSFSVFPLRIAIMLSLNGFHRSKVSHRILMPFYNLYLF